MMVGAFALHTAAIAQQVHCPDRHIRAKHPAYAQHTDPAQMRAITSGIGAVCLEISKQNVILHHCGVARNSDPKDCYGRVT